MSYTIPAAIITILILVALYFLTNPKNHETTKEESQKKQPIQRYYFKGNHIEAFNTDEDIYNLLLRIGPTDFIVFENGLPELLETLKTQKEASVSDHILKVQNNPNVIGDDQGNYWSIIECYPNSFMVYLIDGEDIEDVNLDDEDLE